MFDNDICKCEGEKKDGTQCPSKMTCFRYTSKPDKYMQNWFVEAPFDTEGTCRHYWETEDIKKFKKTVIKKVGSKADDHI